jgi:hypothetical protein
VTTRNVVIVMGRCSRTRQGYGIRFEQRNAGQWTATWAFAIKDNVAKREGYEKSTMTGNFAFDDAFPGCPHCTSHTFFRCQCGKLGCWDGVSLTIVCPSCGQTGELVGELTTLEGGGDR